MAVIMSLISIMSTLDNPEQVGRLVAAAMSGFFWPCSFLRKILFFYDLVFRRMNPDRRPGSDRHRTRSFFALLSDLGRFFAWGGPSMINPVHSAIITEKRMTRSEGNAAFSS